MPKNKNKNLLSKLAVVGTLLLPALVHAQTTDTIPDATEMTTKVAAIAGIAGTAATIGFGIWIYRRTKSKAAQAIG